MGTRTIERAYRMRVYPTHRQRVLLARLFGAARYVWNWALARRTEAYRCDGTRLNWVALSREFTALRRAAKTAWLSEFPRDPSIQVLRDLEGAFRNFLERRAEYPRLKRRGSKSSVRFTLDQRREQLCDQGVSRWIHLDLPGLGRMKLRRTEALRGRLRNVTLSRDGAGRYFASVSADHILLEQAPPPVLEAVGVDLGLRDLLVIHDGRESRRVQAPRSLANTLARLHARIRDQRREALRRSTTAIVRETEVIAIESLRVKAMARGMGRRVFRRSVQDAALGELRRQLIYKSAWAQRHVVAVDALFPSSKCCSACGQINCMLRLERYWCCPTCGAAHDRDENAARNLRSEGLRLFAGYSPATGKRLGSDAREVDCAAEATARVSVMSLQRRPTLNREPTDIAGAVWNGAWRDQDRTLIQSLAPRLRATWFHS